MTETYILALCFILTFGYIGYKMSYFIRNYLQQYREQIANSINDSERLKLQALNLLDEAKKHEKNLNDEIEKNKIETELRISAIKDEFSKKLQEMVKKVTEENAKKMTNEKNIMLENFKVQIKKIITDVIEEYSKKLSQEEKENAISQAILKIDFKKLTQQN